MLSSAHPFVGSVLALRSVHGSGTVECDGGLIEQRAQSGQVSELASKDELHMLPLALSRKLAL